MLFWMRRQSMSVKSSLQTSVDRVLTEGGAFGLALLAFTAVIREGLETSLFLVGQAASSNGAALSVLFGALVGLGLSIVIGVGFYRGASVINLRTFFKWTGIALIFIAGGLLARAVHEFAEIGAITIGTQQAFDLSAILPHEAVEGGPTGPILVVGQLLRALFGYSAQPEVISLVVWGAYVGIVLFLYLRPVKPQPLKAAGDPAPKSTQAPAS
jgi:high-affinity iron transporter